MLGSEDTSYDHKRFRRQIPVALECSSRRFAAYTVPGALHYVPGPVSLSDSTGSVRNSNG